MIKEFFVKKENILILLVALLSIFCIILGFLLLFFKSDSSTPKIVPLNIYDIEWEDFNSKVLDKNIQYPNHMFIFEQRETDGVGVVVSEIQTKDFLTYFTNQSHVSIYPEGIDNQLFYGKTKESKYTSSTGQDFKRTEYFTVDGDIWAIKLDPEDKKVFGQTRGFIWIQSGIKKKEQMCISSKGVLINNINCDPYSGEQPVFKGEVSDQFIRFGYEIINKNSF